MAVVVALFVAALVPACSDKTEYLIAENEALLVTDVQGNVYVISINHRGSYNVQRAISKEKQQ